MSEMAAAFTRERGILVSTQFGASGRMRERIEAGDKVDVFTSADIGHAAKLVADGRATVMAMFARNALCLLAPAGRAPAGSAGAPVASTLPSSTARARRDMRSSIPH